MEHRKTHAQARMMQWYLLGVFLVALFGTVSYSAFTNVEKMGSASALLAVATYEEARDACSNDPDFEGCIAAYGYQWSGNGLEECTPESCPAIDPIDSGSPTIKTTDSTSGTELPSPTFTEKSGFLKGGIVKCGKDGSNGGKIDFIVDANEACHVKDIFELFDRALRFVYLDLILPLAALSFLIAGWFLLTSGGDPGNLKKAKTIITDTFIGIALVLCAWLIVHTVVKYITDDKGEFYVPLEQGN